MIPLLTAAFFRPFGLAAAAWLLLRVFRIRHPESRHAVWTAVMIGIVLLPLVSVTAPHWEVRVLPAKPPPAVMAVVPEIAPLPDSVGGSPQISRANGFAWPTAETLLVWGYFAGVLAMIAYRSAGWSLARRVLARSTPVKAPWLRESRDVLTPVALGWRRPIVILPAGWREWSATTRSAVLAHEFAHLRRRDAMVSAIGRGVQSLLWFHPLAWWVSREVSDLAEQACDAAAVARLGDPGVYSRILLEFTATVDRAGGRVTLPGMAMTAGTGMERRIDHVFELSRGSMRRLARPGVVLALVGVPVMALVATAGLGFAVAQEAVRLPLPAFEAASIRPCKSPGLGRSGGTRWSPGRLDIDCTTVRALIAQSYLIFGDGRRNPVWVLGSTPIEGGPTWINNENFEIHIKAEGTPPEAMMRGPMLQALLAKRFQLKIIRKIREISVYELRVARGGHKLKPFQPGSCRPIDFADDVEGPDPEGCRAVTNWKGSNVVHDGRGMDTGTFAKFMLYGQDRPVVDKTGLSGRFDFLLEYAPEENSRLFRAGRVDPNDPARGASIFTAIKEQLGLELVAAKGQGEYLLIERVERPSEN